MHVVLADIEEAPLQAAASDIRSGGVTVLPVRTDVSKEDDVQRLLRLTLDTFGAVHVLCNNAGVINPKPRGAMWESPLQDWQWVLGVNLWGVIHGIRTFVPAMVEQDVEAHIVNTASAAGLTSAPYASIYSMTKHAVVNLTEGLHRELALRSTKIGASVVCPAWTRTSIGTADRNRPSRLTVSPGSEVRPPEGQSMDLTSSLTALYGSYEEPLRTELQQVVEPVDVAERVLHAIQNNIFYVFTHPAWNVLIRNRMDDILQCRNPGIFL
jgi:NAD(P)-dependent dehydrogenase (short-subunit alcohol dehydrogenase family)